MVEEVALEEAEEATEVAFVEVVEASVVYVNWILIFNSLSFFRDSNQKVHQKQSKVGIYDILIDFTKSLILWQ